MFFTSLLGCLLSCAGLFSQSSPEPISTDRPDQTEAPSIVPRRHIQFETGMGFETEGNTKTFQFPVALLRYGIGPAIELRLESAYSHNPPGDARDEYGLDPVEVGLKTSLMEGQGWKPAISLITHVGLDKQPKANRRQATKYKAAPSVRFTLAHEASERIAIGYNLGVEWSEFFKGETAVYTLAAGFALSERWGGFLEIFGDGANFRQWNHSLDGGLTFQPKPNWQLDFSVGVGLTPGAPDFLAGLGLSFRLPR